MTDQSGLAGRMIDARKTKDLTAAQTANRVGVKLKTYENWEAGKTEPRANRLQILAGVLGVPLLWLIQGAEEHDPVMDEASRLDQLEAKLDRLGSLQREVTQLTSELSEELTRIRGAENGPEEIAA